MVYNFTKEQIKEHKPISFPCNVVIKTKDLISDKANLTNYMIKATLTVKQSGENTGQESGIKTTQDFFIYTVTKLKYE